jgi:hypothetical protein
MKDGASRLEQFKPANIAKLIDRHCERAAEYSGEDDRSFRLNVTDYSG